MLDLTNPSDQTVFEDSPRKLVQTSKADVDAELKP
jgi:hypothetical protein